MGGLIVELTVKRVEGPKVERVEGITVERVVGPAAKKYYKIYIRSIKLCVLPNINNDSLPRHFTDTSFLAFLIPPTYVH